MIEEFKQILRFIWIVKIGEVGIGIESGIRVALHKKQKKANAYVYCKQ